jgi:hypothetical protein
MPEGGTVTISTRSVTLRPDEVRSPNPAEAGPHFAVITVKDTGKGMTKEVMEHIFEPFYTTKEKGKGTGLGLSMVYGVMKQHNGWVNVKSEPGQGTEFSAYLPAKPCPAGGADGAPGPAPAVFAPVKASILVVEDDQDLRDLAVKALGEFGHTVVQASSGKEALKKFREAGGLFDLIFTDMELGDTKAPRLVNDFLAINPKIKMIFTSGYLEEKTTWDFINSKGYIFIAKPYSVDALIAAIEDIMREKRA